MADKSLALRLDGKVAAIPYAVEGYGIIYNDATMNAYFALPDRWQFPRGNQGLATLKAVVEDMQKHKDALGIRGCLCQHLHGRRKPVAVADPYRVNVPLYYEFLAKAPDYPPPSSPDWLQRRWTLPTTIILKDLMDLYTNNSLTPKTPAGLQER